MKKIKEEKPDYPDEYKNWVKENINLEISKKIETHYDSVVNKILHTFENDKFWTCLNKNLNNINDEYLLTKHCQLFMNLKTPQLLKKPFNSFLLKTYRKNISDNSNWPTEPNGGWICLDNWFKNINDLVRTTYIVKYMDGVEFLVDKINKLSKQCGFQCFSKYQAKEEGYYAAHVSLTKKFEIPRIDWNTELTDITVEIQITTQLQEVIRQLLRKYYKQKRKQVTKKDEKWQWDYKSDEFATNYLGHILHYIEGMILDIRNRQKEGIK